MPVIAAKRLLFRKLEPEISCTSTGREDPMWLPTLVERGCAS